MIAIAVLAYSAPKTLAFSAKTFHESGMKVFVHLDKKMDLDAYITEMGGSADHCEFINNRKDVFWSGFNMIEATIELISAALSVEDISRIALVSDDSVPCRRMGEIVSELSMDAERISMRKLTPQDPFFERYRGFFFFDHKATSLKGRPIETSQIDLEVLSNVLAANALMVRGKKVVDVYYGSQWWCITRSCAEIVVQTHQQDTHLRESFKFSAVPDESYIQTIIGNYALGRRVFGSPMLVDWSREPRPFIFSSADSVRPYIRDHHSFVRKVRFNEESEINLTT